ncbi:hypothetical protein NBRC116188_30030 [Oceaniserpentilla sp. 4NH20-0058]|uniref:hypothetical protein n=1 Tax=Oceaniserpentilla sp. 4NH20-0058 TaxID=3127660 RepID=UPI00310C7E8E
MKKVKEPEQLASIALSREEIASRQRVVGKPRIPSSQVSSSTPKMLWLLVIISLVICVGLAVQFYQFKQQSDIQLQALTILQERLTSTDEQANLSVDAMKILLKEQDHEIRKLWDLSNKRNKVDISKNKKTLDSQKKVLSKQSNRIESINKDLTKLEKGINKQVTEKISDVTKSVDQTKANTLLLETKVDKAISAMPKDVAKTLSDHDKGIKAMDATRLQLMRRIQGLEKKIEALEKSTSTPVAAQP